MDFDQSDPDSDPVPVDRWKRPDDLSPAVDHEESDDFEAALATLDDGASILVVGEAPAEARTAVCRQLMGDDDPTHRRVVALTGDERHDVGKRLPDGASDRDHLRVITDGGGVRDGVAADPDWMIEGAAPDDTSVVTVDGEIGSFGAAITNAIVGLEPHDREFEPGELRVCVDELRPLFEQVPRQDVVQFVHLLGHRTRGVGGRAHFHLPIDADDQRASVLATVCDVLIDVRVRDGQPRQRWHLRGGPASEWLPVPADLE